MNYGEIIKSQQDYFKTHVTKDPSFRVEQLKKLRSVLKQHEQELYAAIYGDFKKSEFDTYASELGFVYGELDKAIRKVRSWSKRKWAGTNVINLPGHSYILPEPLGVCLIIGAWNYPYMLSLIPLISAMGAGNTVILKPSEIPSATSAVMHKIINDNFDARHICVIEGGAAETSDLLSHKFDLIFFTGSTSVGKIIYQAAAKHLTPVILELGGKSPAIITKNTNVRDAAKRITWAKFLNAGQTCIAPDYLLIDESIRDPFLAELKAHIVKYQYAFENNNYVQIINDRNFQRLVNLIDTDKIYFGGSTNKAERLIEPTILTDINFDHPIMKEEIFGPVLPVISYSILDRAVEEVINRPKPLACYIFTNDAQIRKSLLHKISFGGGAVNDTMMQITNGFLPFGGVGESGFGSYHGKRGFDAFSHFKSIVHKPFWFELNLKYPPYSKSKLAWIKRLIKL